MDKAEKKLIGLIQISEELTENFLAPQIPTTTDAQLKKEGWERRQIVGPDRLEETMQLYQEIGFDVHKEKVNQAEFDAACQGCALVASNYFTTLYTRKIKA